MNRRNYFKQMFWASGGILLTPQVLLACNNESTDIPAAQYSFPSFDSFEKMQKIARQSKGHLAAEMKRMIATKNAKSIFEFVANRFSSIPSSAHSIHNAAYETRWGKRGLLRCGKGTLREKSDLLFELLEEAE
ncbi:MAG TPA: hypothetical protein ENK52_04120, partial [Saprospiraceae bacterium]|nr:hypothetical protein [Saprospiraceae bacterium]